MKKNKSKNQNQENTIRKIELNNTVDKKEQTYIMKNNSNKQRTRRRRRGRRNPRNNYSRTIELNVGFIILKIIVIVLLALLITTLTAKTVMTRIGAKESISETEGDVQSIDDSSDYAITVTEYTEDTLEAEADYEDRYCLLYIVDGDTLEQNSVKILTNSAYISDYVEEKPGYNINLNLFYAYARKRG